MRTAKCVRCGPKEDQAREAWCRWFKFRIRVPFTPLPCRSTRRQRLLIRRVWVA